MEFVLSENWSGGPGKILHTKHAVYLAEGDNYIGYGISGENIFTCYGKDVGRYERKVVARTENLKWMYSGNNTLKNLPIINF